MGALAGARVQGAVGHGRYTGGYAFAACLSVIDVRWGYGARDRLNALWPGAGGAHHASKHPTYACEPDTQRTRLPSSTNGVEAACGAVTAAPRMRPARSPRCIPQPPVERSIPLNTVSHARPASHVTNRNCMRLEFRAPI
ncbi:hypothetical protein EVAR_79398_1 [Eumeta japonica]|uniref:Uncharacterized protein n=1 Tax=Eumeta variegata TaxID=151549 RepID=A0A4C1VIB8_EUMVA|nr:hypothetical protein EVAR_79398_1 [Eumeta japonica]